MNQEPPDADLERMLRNYFAESEQRPPDFERFWRKLDATLDATPVLGSEASPMVAPRAVPASNGAAPEPFTLTDGKGYDFVLDDTLEDSMSNGHDQSGRQPSTTERSNRWDTSRRGLSARATAIAAIAAALILAVIATTIYTQFATRRTPHPTATATAGSFTKFAVPEANTRAIAALEPTQDGGLWFADAGAVRAKISRLNPDGSLTEFPIPTADKVKAVYLYGLVVAPDGNLWVSGDEAFDGSVFTPFLKRMTPDGTITEVPLPASPRVTKLVNGPDGALWFIAYENRGPSANANPIVNEIGRITMDGHITIFPSLSEENLGSI